MAEFSTRARLYHLHVKNFIAAPLITALSASMEKSLSTAICSKKMTSVLSVGPLATFIFDRNLVAKNQSRERWVRDAAHVEPEASPF